MKTITVLSGKGGVGKSSIAASLSVLLAETKRVTAVDCDVDASNLALVLGIRKLEKSFGIKAEEKAYLVEGKCASCGACANVCKFSAITMAEGKPVIDESLCEGCGACVLACPNGALALKPVENAVIGSSVTEYGFPVVSGQLKMGSSGSGKVVFAVRKHSKEIASEHESDFIIQDSAAGIGCTVIASVKGSDYVVAVTEPTPASFEDLKRALGVVEHFGIHAGIVINKADMNPEATEQVRAFARDKGMAILAEIPFDRSFVDALVHLKPPVVHNKALEPMFQSLLDSALDDCKAKRA
jgi:MinD superfamily P-loop ATPase